MTHINFQRLWPLLLLVFIAAVEVALVGAARFPAMIDPDSAQLMSAAKNLMAGNGLSTSALYYEEQFALGAPPVPLTVWPPGMAFSAIPLLALGFSASTAAFLISATGHAATILLSYWICLLAGLRREIALGVGISVACLALSFTLIGAGYAEPAFTATTLASAGLLLLSRESSRPLSLLLASGAFATAAISFRYAGLAWLAGAMATFTVFHLRSGPRQLLLGLVALGALPIAFCAALFARNLQRVGTLTGGPLLGGDSNVVEIVRNSYWALLRLFGATGSTVGTLIVVTVLAALTFWIVWKVTRVMIGEFAGRARLLPGPAVALTSVLTYVGATAVLLFYLSFSAYPGFVKERYLLPVIPFVLIGAGIFVADLRAMTRRLGGIGTTLLASSVSLVFVAFVAGQYRVHAKEVSFIYSTVQVRVADAVSRATVAGVPLVDYLGRNVSLSHPLFADRGQVLSAIIDRPTIELPLPEYSRLTYDDQTVHAMMRRMNSCLLLIHPATTAMATGDRRILYKQLASGVRPGWLHELMNDSGLLLFKADWCEAEGS